MEIKTARKLLTKFWTADVDAIETGLRRARASGSGTNECDVVFFEIAGDERLHVNVTHRYPTRTPRGWAGPAAVERGFVHNRTFAEGRPLGTLRHVRDMVLATRTVAA